MKSCSSAERAEMRLLIDVGSGFMMISGWFECLFMHSGSSLGFLYGLNFPLRSKVTSKKFTTLPQL